MIKRKGAANAVLELVSKGGEHLQLMIEVKNSKFVFAFNVQRWGFPRPCFQGV
jgi:hypothetical protein